MWKFRLFTALALLTFDVYALPSTNSIGSGLQILMHNDLYGNDSTRNEAVLIVDKSQSQAASARNCADLGEVLWTPPIDLHKDNFLAYIAFQDDVYSPPKGKKPPVNGASLYFIAGTAKNGQCMAITPYAQVVNVGCNNQLPALCTQSAPSSGFNSSDISTRWQTQITSGPTTYTGFRDHLSFRFLGIKYGSISQRFEYSTVYQPSGTVSALNFGSICLQVDAIYGFVNGNEDCLHLNLYTPYLPKGKPAKSKLKAVMLWIHGGGLNNGYGSDPTFDGGNLASRGDVIVVTINYRLGALGYLVFGNSTGLNGNYGIGDQITALRWVKANIRSFGGDPNRVMIFGQSAGAESVQALIRSPAAKGLFSAAIQQSIGYSSYGTIESAYPTTRQIIEATNCTAATEAAELACLRAYSAPGFLSHSTTALVVDGNILQSSWYGFNGSAHVNKVPLIIGNMRDDGAPFLTFVDTTNLTQSLSINHEPLAPVLNNPTIFPFPSSGANLTFDVFNATAQVNTDLFDRCQDYAIAYAAAKYNTFPSLYYYEYSRGYQITYWPPGELKILCNVPITGNHPYGDPSAEYYKCHSGELMEVFSSWRKWGLPDRDGNDTPFTQLTIDVWSSFARTYNPNPDAQYLSVRGYTNTSAEIKGTTPWSQVTAQQHTERWIDWPSKQVDFRFLDQCAALGYPEDYLAGA